MNFGHQFVYETSKDSKGFDKFLFFNKGLFDITRSIILTVPDTTK